MKLFGSWRKDPGPAEEQPAFSDPAGSKPAQPLIGKGHKVLVIDDNPIVLKAFDLKLKSLGFTVLSATEGAAAVSVARHEKPDVIVLDINFPPEVGSAGLQWNGFNIMLWLRRFQEVAEIPVVIISSEEAAKVKEKAIAAGAAAYFHKPINNEEFIITLRRLLGRGGKNNTAPASAASAKV